MDVYQFYDNYCGFLMRARGLSLQKAKQYAGHLRRMSELFSPLSDKSVDCFAYFDEHPVLQCRIDFVEYMIDKAKAEKLKPNPVCAEGTLRDYVTAMNALLDYYESLGPSLQAAPRKPASLRKGKKTQRIERNNIPPLPFLGEDDDCEHVYYDPDIPQGERVPGLARHLEEHYGRIIEFLMHALKPDLKEDYLPKKIDVILTKGHPADVYPIDVVERVLRHWDLSNRTLSSPDIIEMLKEDTMTSPILGMYLPDPEESLITIYYENGPRILNDKYFALFESVLCHEYAHHIHHLYLGSYFISRKETARIIKESIADFASFYYCVEYTPYENELGPIAKEKLDGWERYFGSGWPYAEALWFLHVYGAFVLPAPPIPNESKEKLIRVFRESVSFARALGTLHS